MGIFSSRRWMGLTPAVCTVLCFMLSACDSTDDPIEEALGNAKSEMIHLSNGDVVVLSDTTTHTLDATEVDDVVMMSEKASEDLFGPVSRASTTGLRAYGFDCQEPETDWKKIQNATTGKEYIYTIALLNPEDKIIQFIPVTFKMK